MLRARLIYNPTSGDESISSKVGDILNILEDAGYEASAYRTTAKENSALLEAKRVAEAGFNLILAAGGDGTINEVVNGIAGLTNRPKVAIIPAGTTNDYARALNIPRGDPVAATELILRGRTIKVDIGKANEKYFMNIAAGGFMTELTYDVPSRLKSIFGYLAYLLKGAEMLPKMQSMPMRLEYDQGVFDGQAAMFFLCLTNSVGGLEQMVPNAELDDGNFTLIIVKDSNIIEMLQLLSLALNGGKHINHDKIIYVKTKHLKASTNSDKPLMINLDGEYGGDAPMDFRNLKQHIEFFVGMEDTEQEQELVGIAEQELSDEFNRIDKE